MEMSGTTSNNTPTATISGLANHQSTMTNTFENTSPIAHSWRTADPIHDGDGACTDHTKHQEQERTTTRLQVGGVLLGMGRREPNAMHGATQLGKTMAINTSKQKEARVATLTGADMAHIPGSPTISTTTRNDAAIHHQRMSKRCNRPARRRSGTDRGADTQLACLRSSRTDAFSEGIPAKTGPLPVASPTNSVTAMILLQTSSSL